MPNPRHHHRSRTHRRAFTFIEILFSVIILGVGMIMIAGMLPVAIKQNADTRNDLTAKVVVDGGYAYLRTLANNKPAAFPETTGKRSVDGVDPFPPENNTPLDRFMGDELMNLANDDYVVNGGSPTLPATQLKAGRVVPLSLDVIYPTVAGDQYNLSKMDDTERAAYPLVYHQLTLGDRIISSEPRFQWLGFYRRDEGSNTVKLIVVAMRQQNTEAVDRYGPTVRAQEQINGGNGPFLTPIYIEDSLTEPDKVKFIGTPGDNAWDIDVAETGAYLIIAHSPPLNGNANGSGDLARPFRNNGRVFKLAARREDLDAAATGARVWELAPGFDLGPADAGPDGIFGSADDVPDGSMNTGATFAENKAPIANAAREAAVAQYPVTDTQNVGGTVAWAWIIGRGRVDPTSPNSPFSGPAQDLGVLSVDLPLP